MVAAEPLQFLADEQAALRRVATLVAQGAKPEAVFDAVCEETGRLIGATSVNLAHFTADGINLTIAGWSLRGVHVPTGTRLSLDGEAINTLILRSAAPVRVDTYEGVPGELAARLRELGVKSEVGAPVVVNGEVWGGLIAGTDEPTPLPPGSEDRVASFAELVATAVANATARSELIASRARIVTASDEARRKVERDLHDGAQQRFVNAVINLQLADERFESDPASARTRLKEALSDAQDGLAELRDLAAGLHPSILTNRGLKAATEALAARNPLPVASDLSEQRFPAHIEAAAYFVIAEALANATKHAQASKVSIACKPDGDRLLIEVRDDGRGGASADQGSGLRGLEDRVEALGGGLHIQSAPGQGTHLRATLALPPAG
jgi:signal transduction histidine kinase